MESRPWAVVTSGPSSNSLGVVRGLGKMGVPIALADICDHSPARYSKYVRKRIPCPEFPDNPSQLIDTLIAFADAQSTKPVLLPTGDREVLTLSRSVGVLGQYFRFLLPDARCVETATNKDLFYRRLQELNIPHPRIKSVTGLSELATQARLTPFPFLIKPVSSIDFTERFHRKLFVIRSRHCLERSLRLLQGTGLEVLIQEMIPVKEYHEVYCLMDGNGSPMGFASWERLRQFPPFFGTGSLCRSGLCQEVLDGAIDLLQKLDVKGLAAVEVLKDKRDNSYKILEVNTRTTLQNRLAAHCGVDLEQLAYRYLTGKEPGDPPMMQEGLFWVDDFKDSLSFLLGLMRGYSQRQRTNQPWLKRRVHSVLSLDDLVPYPMTLLAYASKVPHLFKSLRVRSDRAFHSATGSQKPGMGKELGG